MDNGSPSTPPPTTAKNQDLSTWPELPSILIDPISGSRFKVGKLLGKGGFAKCYQCTELSTGQMYCCKAIYDLKGASPAHQLQFESEKKILQKLDHPNIIGFKMHFATNGFSCLILELCAHGTLLSLLKQRKFLVEYEARVLIKNFIMALIYLREQGILHRDLKLANLLLADGPSGGLVLKLGDFGLAVQIKARSDERRWTMCGTPNFIAPEVVKSSSSEGYGHASDVWSLGIVLYTMLIGSMPFTSTDREALFDKIQTCEYRFPLNRPISFKAKALVCDILKKEPESRPTLEEILQHKFFIPSPNTLPLISLSRRPSEQERIPPSRQPLTVVSNIDNRVLKASRSSPLPTTGIKRKRIPFDELKPNARPLKSSKLAAALEASADTNIEAHAEPALKSDASPSKEEPSDFSKNLETTPLKPWLADFAAAIESELTSNKDSPDTTPSCQDKAVNYVVRWLKSEKLPGVGFGMKDGSVTILFRDSSIMAYRPDLPQYEYRKENNPVPQHLEPQDLPLDLQPKAKSLSRFRAYMAACVAPATKKPSDAPLVVVTRFGNTRQAVLYTLSSQVFQVDFKSDHVKVILSDKGKCLTLVLPNRPPCSYSLGSGKLRQDPPPGLKETPDRLLYILKLIRQILNSTTSSN
ncbi:Serine/threonine-protein kinase plk1 [Entomophthora muscae]|uniref:Serine/threonine-protein kinase plk1 n=1 Tax=Entomophthora muscae TaxID=34485 RepID=A0ACC2TU17_9FUNG|nr:Serine/threonine-protein kinase plk1 [Entomophthora muscae]